MHIHISFYIISRMIIINFLHSLFMWIALNKNIKKKCIFIHFRDTCGWTFFKMQYDAA